MSKVITIGEALIDFIPEQKGRALKDVEGFTKMPGGAPANVAAGVSVLGAKSALISMLGEDAFGDFLVDTLAGVGVDTSYIKRTRKANTGLAFVSLKENGERDFSFYRNPSSDLLLEADEIEKEWFESGDILHYCSVDLVPSPMKEAHKRAIEYTIENDGIISFDPNVRLPLWEDANDCKETINAFIPYSHILKVSDEELEFITGISNEEEALNSLFVGNVKMIIYTVGAKGARLIFKDHIVESTGFKVKAIDTTGAGDSFIGSFLYSLVSNGVTTETLISLSDEVLKSYLQFSNAVAAIVVTRKGAISSIPHIDEVKAFIEANR